jgi:glyoxylase-like metal-dependent hydrolase (beta-lactamase superfamily II)
VFPSAKILANKTEVAFWTSEHPDLSGMKVPAEMRAQALSTTQKTLAAVKGSLELKSAGKMSPEIELVTAPGHTPGHSLFKVSRGGESLLVMVMPSTYLRCNFPIRNGLWRLIPHRLKRSRRAENFSKTQRPIKRLYSVLTCLFRELGMFGRRAPVTSGCLAPGSSESSAD